MNSLALTGSLPPGHDFPLSPAKHMKSPASWTSLPWKAVKQNLPHTNVRKLRYAYKISRIMNISPVKSCETYKISRILMYVSKSRKRKVRITFFFFFTCHFFLESKHAQFDGCKILIFWFLTPSSSQKLTALCNPLNTTPGCGVHVKDLSFFFLNSNFQYHD